MNNRLERWDRISTESVKGLIWDVFKERPDVTCIDGRLVVTLGDLVININIHDSPMGRWKREILEKIEEEINNNRGVE